ncbi:MAG: hypothetical protein ABIR98_01700 [Usitatibacter sp.]
MDRKTIPVAHLYAILDREFKRRRPAACTRCNVPLPFYQRPPDDVSANWFIGTAPECPFGCHLLIAEVLAELWTKYDIDRMPVH